MAFESDVPLDDLVDPGPSRPGLPPSIVVVRRGEGPPPLAEGSTPAEWPSIQRRHDCFHLQFHDLAVFTIDPAVAEIRWWPLGNAPPGWLPHLLLDHVCPRFVGLAGKLVLHACAAAPGGDGVGIVGASGAGKSTMAVALLRRGLRVLSDDALVLEFDGEEPKVLSTHRALRLW